MKDWVRALAARIGRLRKPRSVVVIDQTPLFGGCTVHVIDVGGERLVFASTSSAICVLARFEAPSASRGREEPAWSGV